MKMKLYEFGPTRSIRVRWTLQELGVDFEPIRVNLLAGEHRRPEFLKITAGDDVAFCHSLNRMMATTTKGSKVDLWFRQTLCFRKIDGRWRITHEHSSVPFHMDGSYKAAVDLNP